VATISTRFERCAAFDMTILFGCSADAGNIGRLALVWGDAPLAE